MTRAEGGLALHNDVCNYSSFIFLLIKLLPIFIYFFLFRHAPKKGDSKLLYLAIMGEIFDVTRGEKARKNKINCKMFDIYFY